MSPKTRLLAGTALGAALLSGAPAHAQATAPSPAQSAAQTQELQRQINALKQQLDDLQVRLGNKVNQVQKAQADAPKLEFNRGRFTMRSADGNFSLALRSRLHFDYGYYDQDSSARFSSAPDLNSGFNVRRAELGVEGTFAKDWIYAFTGQYGGTGGTNYTVSLKEAYVGYKGLKPVTLIAGVYQPPMTMSDTVSSNDTMFMERPSIVNLATSLGAGDSRYSVGARGNGEEWMASLFYTGGTTTNSASAVYDDQSNGVGRIAYSIPFAENAARVHVGASGTYVFANAQTRDPATTNPQTDPTYGLRLRDRPELRVDGNRLIDTGSLNAQTAYAYGPEFAANYQGFTVQSEAYKIGVDREGLATAPDIKNQFWGAYVEASYILTGETRRYSMENAAYGAPRPASPFSLSGGGWGAWEVVGKYSYTDLNDNEGNKGQARPSDGVRGGEQKIFGLGVNWYPIDNVRFMADWLNVDVDRLSSSGAGIGQTYNVFAIRTQYAF